MDNNTLLGTTVGSLKVEGWKGVSIRALSAVSK